MGRKLLAIGGLLIFCLGVQAQGLRIENTVVMEQQGEGHQLTFSQRGLGHQLDLKQIEGAELPPVGYRNGYHRMRIDQQGYGQSAILHQYGAENGIESYQSGWLNSLSVYQGNSVYGSLAAMASTNQLGINNRLDIEQIVSGTIWHQQIGSENTAFYSLEGGMDYSVRQLGNRNNFEGGGAFGDQVFSALQSGNGNQASLGNFLAIGGAGYANMRQLGDDNAAYGSLEQGLLDIRQEGDRNQSHIEIFRGSGEGTISQLGDDNQALISLAELSDMKADIVQDGSGNSASAILSQSGSMSSIDQKGNSNQADISLISDLGNISLNQSGNQNRTSVNNAFSGIHSNLVQEGNGNQLQFGLELASGSDELPNSITQQGDDNNATIANLFDSRGAATVRQQGQGNQADLLFYNATRLEQIGNGNGIRAEQFYGLGIEAYQEGDRNYSELLQIEGGNLLNASQRGDDNQINAYQASSGFIMESKIRQEGNQNRLTGEQYSADPVRMEVDQLGNNNYGEYEQGNINNGRAKIMQQGNDNQAILEQTYSYSSDVESQTGIWQEGNANAASVLQAENYELAVQTAVHQLGDDNLASVSQRYGGGNLIEILQEGDGNAANLAQANSISSIQLQQLGNFNSAQVNQLYSSTTLLIDTRQKGSANQVVINDYESNLNDVRILQEGNGNEAVGTAEAAYYSSGLPSGIAITQLGNDNQAQASAADGIQMAIHQEGNKNKASSYYIFEPLGQSEIRQQGNANDARVLLFSGSLIEQLGDRNFADVFQVYGLGAQVYQEGNENAAEIVQADAGDLAMLHQEGDANLSYILQSSATSRNLQAEISQFGEGNRGELEQYDILNARSAIQQRGNYNTARIEQFSGYDMQLESFARIIQLGSFNEASITQSYEAHGSQGEIWQLGSNNQAILEQLLEPSNLRIMQVGNGNYMHLSQ